MHAAGVIHRGICPENLIFDTGLKTLKIVDFGMAVDVGVNSNEEEQNQVLPTSAGTLVLQPPEMQNLYNKLGYTDTPKIDYHACGKII
jgi:serine/threonine protein kinase